MGRPLRTITALSTCVILSACVTHKTKYSWGGYDQALYYYYKHPADAAHYMTALRAAINGAAKNRQPVAPGVYAEYGYMLMQQQKYEEASSYFEQEKQAWPESAQFMDGMIRAARLGGKPAGGSNSR